MMIDRTGTVATAAGLSRRSLLAIGAIAALPFGRRVYAGPGSTDAILTIQHLSTALLAVMKSGGRTTFNQRFQALVPAVDEAFDLSKVLEVSIGPSWASLPPDQQTRLLDAFRRYTVASYVANFDSYDGQKFTVSPEPRDLESGRVIVQSQIVPVNGSATELDYVMQQTISGWKIVDVLAAGSISRVAVQRSDFRHLLSKGGGDALVASLQHKTNDLSGGALA